MFKVQLLSFCIEVLLLLLLLLLLVGFFMYYKEIIADVYSFDNCSLIIVLLFHMILK